MSSCRGCDKTWSSIAWAHCSSCHESFLSVTYFDWHRVNGDCWGSSKIDGKANRHGALVCHDGVWGTLETHEHRDVLRERMSKKEAE